jgi:dihydroflavonol-4-reductase
VARTLARAGLRVRGLSRKPPGTEPGDPRIEWLRGDLTCLSDRKKALSGMAGVVHCASWVSLGPDRSGESRVVNVECTRALLAESQAAGIERFVYTSTLWTVAAGSEREPADEGAEWNLDRVRGPYCDTKREAESLVLEYGRNGLRTCALCPGMVIGPRDPQFTSTMLLLMTAATPVAILPRGGLPVVDADVVALAHLRALERSESGARYVIVGPYLSYHDLSREIGALTGWPLRIVTVPDVLERPLAWGAHFLNRVPLPSRFRISPALMAGGFLHLHVSGAVADRAFGLRHPAPAHSLFEALNWARCSGRAPWLRLREPTGYRARATDIGVSNGVSRS